MSVKEIKRLMDEKKQYEPPVLLWLGELANTIGVCEGGSANIGIPNTCTLGNGDGVADCGGGTHASFNCGGGSAQGAAYRPWMRP